MSLTDHARAARILGAQFEVFGDKLIAGRPANAEARQLASIATMMGGIYLSAAELMDAEALVDVQAIGGACTLDHSHLNGPAKCVACGARKA
jgi:hypothetical protein